MKEATSRNTVPQHVPQHTSRNTSRNMEVLRQLLDAGAQPPQNMVARLRQLAAPGPRVVDLLDRAPVTHRACALSGPL